MIAVKGPSDSVKKITCSKCGYVLEYSPPDLHQHFDDFDYPEGEKCIKCPRCKGHTEVRKPVEFFDL